MSEEKLRAKILQLEEELVFKQNELLKYKTQLGTINHQFEKLIAQLSSDQKTFLKIQRALSPVEIPRIQGFDFSTKFVPGHKSGGDYFDIFELEDKFHFGIVLSSCSGYAVSALLLSVLMKLASQIEAKKGMAPHLVLKKIFADIQGALKEKDQVSIFYGLFDRRHFSFSYAVCGEIAAFIQSHGKIQALSSQSFELPQKSEAISLQSKDRLILCSTGIAQTQDLNSEPFGIEQLEKVILNAPKQGVHELRNEILFRLEQYSQTTEPVRDLTLLVTEVQERVIKLTHQES